MKKPGLWYVFLLIISIFLAACSNEGSSGGGEASSSDDDAITIRMGVSGDSDEKNLRYETGDLFMEQNPHINIDWVDIDGDRYQQTLTFISGGNAPDILYINDYMRPLAERDVLLPLEDFIEGDPEFSLDPYYDYLIDALRHDDTLYALPQEVSPLVMYYNKDIFDEAGVPYPEDDWTQEDFWGASARLVDSAENRYALLIDPSWLGSYGHWIYRHGGEIFNDDYTESALNSAEVLEGLIAMKTMVENEYSPNPAELSAMGQGDDAMFRNQQVAMINAGLWWLPSFQSEPLDFNWDVVKLPIAQNQHSHAGVLNWSILAETEHPEEAWEVLKFFVGEEGMEIVAKYNMAAPAGDFEEAHQTLIDSEFPENIQAFMDAAPDVRYPEFHHSSWAEIHAAITEQLDLMLLGNQTPEETQENMYREMNSILGVN